ncbi:hypothetical protein [Nocardioides sp. CER19]|uniref:hypothetical protein n=1 Tax=Nocardioides sp. CER19 TaxID=3038538 RepID=UPI00244C47E1|nr:hypothetical protein [Nocardioides sp. CER19]MDH2414580.1 hypothetical protein [Nocardioides sp. CER19]
MEPSATSYLCLAVGIVLTGLGVWQRLGRGRSARAWSGAAGEGGVRLALFVLPGIGLLALALGLGPWADDVPAIGLLLLVLVLAGALLLFGWGMMRLPYPRWAVPGWARHTIALRFEKEGWLR